MSDPTFQKVFGSGWHELPSALQQRYANRPFTHDVVTIDGHLSIEMSWLARLLAPILYLTRTLVPWPGENIPVTVRFRSEPGSDACHFERSFRFPGRRPWHFNSTLRPREGADLIETMPVGIGWQARYSFDGGKVHIARQPFPHGDDDRAPLARHALRLPRDVCDRRCGAGGLSGLRANHLSGLGKVQHQRVLF